MSELKCVVNCWTIHTSDDPDHPHQAQLGRPQDWGDPKWMYRVYTLEALGYRNEVHCWLDSRVHDAEHLALFAGVICTITLPGSNPKLTGKAYLEADDFWSAEWAEMPPYYDAAADDDNNAER